MTPQTQEYLHRPDEGSIGDCLRAAIASILDTPIAEVPHFASNCWPDQAATDKEVREFLSKRGLTMIQLDYLPCAWLLKWQKEHFDIDCYHLIAGTDPEGEGHVCVGLNGQLIHDPHPMRRWFADVPEQWKIILFISLDPAKSCRAIY